MEYAKTNVENYNLGNKIHLIKGNWLDPLQKLNIKLDGIITNPPYIPTEDILHLQDEVRKHEPHLALDGGHNGVDEIKVILILSIKNLHINMYFNYFL